MYKVICAGRAINSDHAISLCRPCRVILLKINTLGGKNTEKLVDERWLLVEITRCYKNPNKPTLNFTTQGKAYPFSHTNKDLINVANKLY